MLREYVYLGAELVPVLEPGGTVPAADLDGDGVISVGDARKVVLRCDLPRCEVP